MIARGLLLFSLLFYMDAASAAGHADRKSERRSECARTKEKIRAVQAKMRSGYTRAQGEKLEARLRQLRARRKKACR